MVIILIVFLTLVSGMCASIIVSCWGKIQERRRRKQEYHSRKSRETSMEGQLNKVDQMVYGTASNSNGTSKQRVAAAEVQQQQTGSKFFLHENSVDGSQRYLAAATANDAYLPGVQYQQHPLVNQMLSVDGNYGGMYSTDSNHPIMTSETSLDTKADMEALREAAQDQKLVGQVFGSRQKVHDIYTPEHHHHQLNKSLQNVQQSILASMAQQQSQQVDQILKQKSVPDSNNYQYRIHSGLVNNNENNQQQQHIPASNANNGTLANHDAQQQMLNIAQVNLNNQQQKLNSSIFQQHNLPDNNKIASNNNNNSNNEGALYGRYLRQQQDINGIPGGVGNSGTINLGHLLNHSASAQTMPISLAKYNNLLQSAQLSTGGQSSLLQPEVGQKLNYETRIGGRLATNTAYNPQRALTMSTMHQPQIRDLQQRNLQSNIYGINCPQQTQSLATSHLSSSVTCCNLLNLDDCANETPLLNDLIAQAAVNQQQQYRLQQQQTGNDATYELKSRTLGPRMPSGNVIPRSISAHQLSKAQLRQSQQLQQSSQAAAAAAAAAAVQQQMQQKQQLHQLQPHQLSYKSMSDAGHVIRHQPPNHSLSYPHACTGPHLEAQPSGYSPKAGHQSPALPPPPPPPNLVRGPATCSRIVMGSLPAPPPSLAKQMDNRRAAFKVSRLDQSQLTGDTLQDSDLIMANLPKGTSMQFDEPSTESDATFGMLMNSIGNTPLNMGSRAGLSLRNPLNLGQQPSHLAQMNQQQLYFAQAMRQQGGAIQQQPQQQQMVLTHLGDCNFVRHQRANQLMSRPQELSASQLVCDCGALERANQMRQQQQQQHLQQVGSSHEFDDSDDAPYLLQGAVQGGGGSFASLEQPNNSNMMLSAQRTGLVGLHVGNRKNPLHSAMNSSSNNNSIYGQRQIQQLQQQQRYARFRHQSSEMTGDDDEYDDEDDLNGYNVGQEEDEESSDGILLNPCLAQPTATSGNVSDSYRVPSSVIRNEQTLRDAPLRGSKHLSGSRTSIGCQSCTCGSQLQLDQVGASEEEQSSEQSNSGREKKQNTLVEAPTASLKHEKDASTSLASNDQKPNQTAGITSERAEPAASTKDDKDGDTSPNKPHEKRNSVIV